MPQTDGRPTPESLLPQSEDEGGPRGRLKIFLGAYPGVGKTYSMLQAAHERRKDGIDVVVGIVETHGRIETEALLRGLEVVPRAVIDYRGRDFTEMALDAVIARKPQLVLVDELAHTNIPGSRHAKRYRDIEELLEAGIDVYTTVNIQHIESRNDAVQRITRVTVRETVPDTVIQAADIELVDLPPEELIQRLRQGKVYMGEAAGRAATNFFSKGTLTALRELALRLVAERVDAQMVTYMAANAIPGPWPTQDRLVVCLNESALAKRLVRTARRMATGARIPWIALHVRSPGYDSLAEIEKDRIAGALRLAESLEGEVVTLTADEAVAATILNFARQRNVTRILIGRQRRRRFSGWFRESVTQGLIEGGADFEVTIISPEAVAAKADVIATPWLEALGPWRGYALSAGAVALATGLSSLVLTVLPLPNVSLVYMTAVILVAIYLGRGPSIFASLLSFVAYNFTFSMPEYTFSMFRRDELLTIVFFLVVSVVVGNLAARLKLQVEALRQSAQRTANLYDFSRKIAAAASLDDVLWAAVHHVASTLHCASMVLLPQGPERSLRIAQGYPPEDSLAPKDRGAAEWAWEKAMPAGWGSDTLPAADWLFLPMKSRRGLVGLLGISFANRERPLAPDQSRLLETLTDQVALAVERTMLAADIEDVRTDARNEQFRATLIRGIAGDLAAPLRSIGDAARQLQDAHGSDAEAARRIVMVEGDRLDRFARNLAAMSSGPAEVELQREASAFEPIAERAHARIQAAGAGVPIRLDIVQMPLARVDPVMIERMLVDLLDNAVRYGRGGEVILSARGEAAQWVIEVADTGGGMTAQQREAAFGLRAELAAGGGIGLAVCRRIAEAHGGAISSRDGMGGRGTVVLITLPLGETA